ncbi:dTDP-4-dehydrorhamnose 3,5-epimerase, partial [candidate division KSB1 bacterium]|nr:dTDP-4-dehydrorhamnose 3,5-epimerase [Phycisphaerae bacterium]NIV94108.1 dTDP-4-dehydrorhamnose 3,5-epimerase [candidate division KSB1 bacterium]
MPTIEESQKISGVMLVQLKSFADSRGRFMETFRKEWFPQRSWQKIQTNRSDSQPNVLRGLHYHH